MITAETAHPWLRKALELRDEDTPFPWQEELLRRFSAGMIERSLDIPTGLGKTAVMAIWLVARAQGAKLPRRLVYGVDRRAVVDQATKVAETLRECVDQDPELKHALGLGTRSLPISTLRGQHVDNKEWLEDPASSAIIVGTVDMIGSRLLFEGYGTSRKMRPYHAGLLGADTLLVLDEAHLVPPFERLLETIVDGNAIFGPTGDGLRSLVPPLRLMSLSATGRAPVGERTFRLQEADLRHPVVKRRLHAVKRLTLQPVRERALEDALAEEAWNLTEKGQRPLRVIVFANARKVAGATVAAIRRLAEGDGKGSTPGISVDPELFVGARRVFERQTAAKRLETHGFLAASKVERTRPAFVVATSAGEVGVDLDADHMVSDLVAWERMVQRLGRVNRRGEGEAEVIVLTEPPSREAQKARAKPTGDSRDRELMAEADRIDAVRQLIERLPEANGARDASPGAIRTLKSQAASEPVIAQLIEAATTPPPLRPALSRALVDAWSMTSLETHPGRPAIDPWLRGWVNAAPQTVVVWRTHLPVRRDGSRNEKAIEDFFEAAPPHISERLETETFHAIDWLAKRARKLKTASAATQSGDHEGETRPVRLDDVVAIALTHAGDVHRTWRLRDLDLDVSDSRRKKERKDALEASLTGRILVVDARLSGLTEEGLLDDQWGTPPRTADDGESWPNVTFRVRSVAVGEIEAGGIEGEAFRFVSEVTEDGEPLRLLVVENSATEERRSAGKPQLLDDHQTWAASRARELAGRLQLPDTYADMLALAASLHDEGKRAPRWQRAFNAKEDGDYAKTRGPINYQLLDGYRHELGSLPVAAARLGALPEDLGDLVLHLIAAHHGFARPVIRVGGCEDGPPSVLAGRAQDVALRFSRLQRRWGPWGLAWWEALLRAVDQQASRDNDQKQASTGKRAV
ncbi:MAG: type I-G CRISPR-associated helicase/endonuclease Cas3g [Vicinamibacterales bacterium]